MLLWNSNRALSMGHSIRRSVRGWCWAVIHTWAWVIVRPRISCYGAVLWRRIWVPPVKGGRVCIGIFGYFGWAERRRSDPSTTAAAADTPTPVGSLVMRLTGSCCRILLPICFGFLQSSGSLPQGFKGKLWFKLVVFYTFDHCFDGIQLHSARLFLQDGPQLRISKKECRNLSEKKNIRWNYTYRCSHTAVAILWYGWSILLRVLQIGLEKGNRRKPLSQTRLKSKIYSLYLLPTLY